MSGKSSWEGNICMNVLCQRFLILLGEEPFGSVYYVLAQTLLEHIDEIQHLTIGELAAVCGVSKSTLSAFVRDIGFEDYKYFRMSSSFQDNKYGNKINYLDNVIGYLKNHSYQDYAKLISKDLERVVHALDYEMIDRLVYDIASHKNVAAFGYMFS